jgi:hypothetical protein
MSRVRAVRGLLRSGFLSSLLLCPVLLGPTSLTAQAQTAAGSLVGIVTDPSALSRMQM